jgi:hypothetical protein
MIGTERVNNMETVIDNPIVVLTRTAYSDNNLVIFVLDQNSLGSELDFAWAAYFHLKKSFLACPPMFDPSLVRSDPGAIVVLALRVDRDAGTYHRDHAVGMAVFRTLSHLSNRRAQKFRRNFTGDYLVPVGTELTKIPYRASDARCHRGCSLIVVDRDYRRRGVARAMLQAAASELDQDFASLPFAGEFTQEGIALLTGLYPQGFVYGWY